MLPEAAPLEKECNLLGGGGPGGKCREYLQPFATMSNTFLSSLRPKSPRKPQPTRVSALFELPAPLELHSRRWFERRVTSPWGRELL